MRKVLLPAALIAALLAGCGTVTTASTPAASKTSATLTLDDAVEKLDTDHKWAGPDQARIVSVYADLMRNRVKVLVKEGTNAKAVSAAAKRATGMVPIVEPAPPKAATVPQPSMTICECLNK